MKYYVVFTIIILILPFSLAAEVLRYKDASGRMHYVDSIKKVPKQYQKQLSGAPALPKITRLPADRFYTRSQSEQDSGSQRKVEIFVTSWCPACKSLERYLKQQKIRYTRYDIERNPSARDRYRKLGGRGVPLIKIEDTLLTGFSEASINAALH